MHRFVSAVLLLLVLTTPARSDPLAEIDRRIVEGDFGDAHRLAAALSWAAPAFLWLPDYVGGYACLSEGDAACAERRARTLLASGVDDPRARHLLITALIAQNRDHAAMHHIARNIARVRDPSVRRQYQAALAAYEERNPRLGASLSMSAMPSTNVTRGTGQDVVMLNGLPFRVAESSREKSGSTITGGLTLYRRFGLGETSDLILSTTATLERGVEDSSTNVFTLAPGLRLQYDLGDLKWSVGPLAEFQWQSGDLMAYRFGAGVDVSKGMSADTRVSLALRAMSQTYPERDHYDGYKASAELGLRRRLQPGLFADLSFEVERQKTEAEHLSHTLIKIGAGVEKYWQNGFYGDASLSLQSKRYDEPGALSDEARRDEQIRVQVGVAHKRLRLFGVMPYIGYRYTRNRSNVSFYDFDSNDLVISARKSF